MKSGMWTSAHPLVGISIAALEASNACRLIRTQTFFVFLRLNNFEQDIECSKWKKKRKRRRKRKRYSLLSSCYILFPQSYLSQKTPYCKYVLAYHKGQQYIIYYLSILLTLPRSLCPTYIPTYSKTMQHVGKDHYTLPSQNLARTITAQSQQDDGENAKQEDGHPRWRRGYCLQPSCWFSNAGACYLLISLGRSSLFWPDVTPGLS